MIVSARATSTIVAEALSALLVKAKDLGFFKDFEALNALLRCFQLVFGSESEFIKKFFSGHWMFRGCGEFVG